MNYMNAVLYSFLMLTMSLSAASYSLTPDADLTTLNDEVEQRNVNPKSSLLNSPGFQEASIYTNTTLSSGGAHTCAILDDETSSCWGKGSSGQLGTGGLSDRTTPTTTNGFGGGRKAISISSGGEHTCAILDTGEVSCWGMGVYGQLGNGATTDRTSPFLTSSLGTGRSAVAISSGVLHTCAILDDGNVSCWGANNNGQLGDGTESTHTTPNSISNINNPNGQKTVAISSGGTHTCALLDDGSVLCWGKWYGSTPNSAMTSTFESGQEVVAIASGRMHICFLLMNGNVSCTGEGSLGQLGNGYLSDNYFSQPVPTLGFGQGRSAIALSAGQDHTCALLDNGSVSCWGNNDYGQVGNGTTSTYAPTPSLTNSFGNGRSAIAISSGGYHTCAILDDDDVVCWGKGGDGQLGNGATSDRTTPTKIPALGEEKNISLSERDLDGDGVLNIFEGIICTPGNYLLGDFCTDADPGYFVSGSGAESQQPCPVGTFQNLSGQTTCRVATTGHFVNSSLGEGQGNQTPCPSGTYNPNNGSTSEDDCSYTDPGHYSDASSGIGQADQNPCPVGTFQPSPRQDSCNGADPGHFVDSSLGVGQTNQTPCPAGTYQADAGQTSCDVAGIGHFVNQSLGSGQVNQTPCPIGTYQDETGRFTCDGADKGFFVDPTAGVGQSEQTPCSLGTFQAEIGQTSCDGASKGHFVDLAAGLAQSAQTPCPMGTYNPEVNSTDMNTCLEADFGYFVNASNGLGQIEQTLCPIGTYNSESGATDISDCILAGAGHYSNSSHEAPPYKQIPCQPGTYQPSQGKGACLSADEGHVVPSLASIEQTPCNRGTYQPSTGLTECLHADPGFYVNETGQSHQNECPIGMYSNVSGSTFCDEAGLGFYVDGQNRTKRIQCPAFTFTHVGYNSTGTTSSALSDCWTDSDEDGLVDDDTAVNSDDDDDNDGVADSQDVFPLYPDEWVDRNGDGLGDNGNPLSLTEEISVFISLYAMWLAIALALIGAGFVALMIRSRTSTNDHSSEATIPSTEQLKFPVHNPGPALPAEGIPDGWTMEQWIHYGDQWLSSQEAAVDDGMQSSLPAEHSGHVDENGYEWYTDAQETSWYRNEGSNSEWQRFES